MLLNWQPILGGAAYFNLVNEKSLHL